MSDEKRFFTSEEIFTVYIKNYRKKRPLTLEEQAKVDAESILGPFRERVNTILERVRDANPQAEDQEQQAGVL